MNHENKFDKYYTFRIAMVNDIEDIMEFIDKYWKKNHIMARNRKLFEYQHLYGQKVTFVLAHRKENNELEAILGYIPASADESKKDVWTAIWKVRDDHYNVPMLGLELIKRLEKLEQCRNIIIVGANPETAVPVMKIVMKYYTSRMSHFYRLGKCKEYRVAANVKYIESIYTKESIKYTQLDEDAFRDAFRIIAKENQIQNVPYKDETYYIRRYYEHPYYKYDIYLIESENGNGIIVLKNVEVNSRKISRIIDYVGCQSVFAQTGNFFTDLIRDKDLEYIDFYCLNFDYKSIIKAGFIERKADDVVIIPNYMEPFLQQNIEIYTCYNDNNCLIFKGDADQDRPNIIEE